MRVFNELLLLFVSVKQTHQVAEAAQMKNDMMRAALGISEHFKDGSSLNAARKAKEEHDKSVALASKKYDVIKDDDVEVVKKEDDDSSASSRSSRSRSRSPIEKKSKKKKKKSSRSRHKSSRCLSRDVW